MQSHQSIRYIPYFLALAWLLCPLFPASLQAASIPTLRDEFNVSPLDVTQWLVTSGTPVVSNGKVGLDGRGGTRATIHSIQQFRYGVVQMAITSAHWKSQTLGTDSSFGFEIWQGANGQCHYGVILIANGHLGLLRSRPDTQGNCVGDPSIQAYIPITNWEAVRAGSMVFVTLTWAPRSVTLHVSTSHSSNGTAVYLGPAEPTNRLGIRLNADVGERYEVDYVRVVGIPWR